MGQKELFKVMMERKNAPRATKSSEKLDHGLNRYPDI